MILLFTLLPKNKCTKNKLLLKYDTNKKRGKLIGNNTLVINNSISTSGLVYSGNLLCVGVQTWNKKDYIVFFNAYTQQAYTKQCTHASRIGNIISIYPGQLYMDSQGTNSIVSAEFDPVNLSYFKDSIHYLLDKKSNFLIKSLCNYRNVWFVASIAKNKILDLTNDRVVYSDIDYPCSLFFNNNHRLCFIERNRNLFHCGDDIFKVMPDPSAVIEDSVKGGYWITCGTDLCFIDYEGEVQDCQDLSMYGKEFNNIIEAKGKFAK